MQLALLLRVFQQKFPGIRREEGDVVDAVAGRRLASVLDGLGHDVHPDHGRRGLGARLLRAVLDLARARGCGVVTLTTYRDLPWNAPFYARHGFAEVAPEDWTADMARRAAAEDVRPGSGRVVMACPLR